MPVANISIIIPNLNGESFLPKCLESLQKAIDKCTPSSTTFEIILVDNASSDNSIKIFSQYFLNSKVLTLDKNYGFAGAVNRGINAATSDWVLLCNNDLKIDEDWLLLVSKFIDGNKNSRLAAISGTVLNYDGSKVESQGLRYYPYGKCLNISNGKSVTPLLLKRLKKSSPKTIWGASAALTVYNRAILNQIGQFDSDFFAYEEDVDLAIRLHHLGYQTAYIPNAICYHLGGGTSNKMGNFRPMMDAKNWIYIIIKNYSKKELISNLFPIIIERLRNLSGLIKQTPKSKIFSTLLQTYQPIFQNYSSMITKRKYIFSLR